MRLLFFLALAAVVCTVCKGQEDGDTVKHTYKDGDPIVLFADKMNPRANPFESYDYNTAPGCVLQESKKTLSLGELLVGDHAYILPAGIRFNRSSNRTILCKYQVQASDVDRLSHLVTNDFQYELIVDEIPVWGAIGEVKEHEGTYIYLHRDFTIGINQHQIVDVALAVGSPVKLESDTIYTFTYSVAFENSDVKYVNRLASVLEIRQAGSRTRLLSLINSGICIFFLISVVTLILSRTLRSEHAKLEKETYLRMDGQELIDESGWRCLYADVFRTPRNADLFCSILGCGTQLLVLIAFIILLSVMLGDGVLVHHNLVTYTVIGYEFTTGIAGYVSGYQLMTCSLLAPRTGMKWIRAYHVTFVLVPSLYAIAFVPSTFVARFYGSSELPYLRGIIVVASMWLLISYPVCLFGVLISRYVFRRTERRRKIPHVNQIPRITPRPLRKLASPTSLLIASGMLPFVTIFSEFIFIFALIWSFKAFHLYGFLTMTVLSYITVTACVSVVSTYVLLSNENHYWKWMSMGFGASSSVYVFVYAIYFYFFKSSMRGGFMFIFYFSHCFAFSLFMSLIGATVGYFASSYFVKKIFAQVKHD